MGFFKKIFKRKKGGSFFGNVLRGVASTLSGGMLGSGKGLAKWQAGQEKKEYEQELAKVQQQIQSSQGYQIGAKSAMGHSADVQNALYNSPEAQQLQNNSAKAWLKRNWWMIAVPVVGIVVLAVVLSKPKRRRR